MSSSSSSKTPAMPEWKTILYGFDKPKQCKSQKALIRSLEILDSLDDERSKGPFSHDEASLKRYLKLPAALIEIQALEIHECTILKLYDEEESLVRSIYVYSANKFLPVMEEYAAKPNMKIEASKLLSVLTAATGTLHWQLNVALIVLQVAFKTEVHTEQYFYNVNLVKEHCGLWTRWQHRWAEMKALGADSILKEIGSNVTIEMMQDYSKTFVVAEAVCDYLLTAKNQPARALSKLGPMVDAITKWFKTYQAAPRSYLVIFLRRLMTTVRFYCLNEFYARSDQGVGSPLLPKWRGCMHTAFSIYRADADAADALKPRDPVLISYAKTNFAHIALSYLDVAAVPMASEALSEAKKALVETKPFLPPWYYQSAKFFLNGIVSQKDKVASEGLKAPEGPPRPDCPFMDDSSLTSCCRGCGISGYDKNLQRCSQCQQIYYCSKECQKKDWKRHKKECKAAGAEKA